MNILFNHLIDKDIQINNLTYQATLKIIKINLKKYIGCVLLFLMLFKQLQKQQMLLI